MWFLPLEPAAAEPDRALPDGAEFEPSGLPASEAGGEGAPASCVSQPAALVQEENAPSRREHSSHTVKLRFFIFTLGLLATSMSQYRDIFTAGQIFIVHPNSNVAAREWMLML